MRYISYKRLSDIVASGVKPYRGTTNRYPIQSRTHNTKCFYVDKEGDDTIFRITYGNTYNEHPVTKEQYAEAYAKGLKHYNEISWRPADAPDRFVRYELTPRELCVVRPDNSVEFTAHHYGQGDNTIMSNWTNGWFYRSSRHGGMVYRHSHRDGYFHPIFKGLRLNCDTMESMTPYQASGYRVMRKTAKEFLKQYKDFYTISHAMMKSMRPEDFFGVAEDLIKELGIGKNSWGGLEINSAKLHKEAQARLHTAPLDSAVLYCMAHDINRTIRRVAHHMDSTQWNPYGEYELVAVFDTMKRKLNTEIYRNNHEVMKVVDYERGRPYPASEWGVTIKVDGKEVEQY